MAKYAEHRSALIAVGVGLMALFAPVIFPHLGHALAYTLFVVGGLLAAFGMGHLVIEGLRKRRASKAPSVPTPVIRIPIGTVQSSASAMQMVMDAKPFEFVPAGIKPSSAVIAAGLWAYHKTGTTIFHAGHSVADENAWHEQTWEWYQDLSNFLQNQCGSKIYANDFNAAAPTADDLKRFADMKCGGDLAQLAASLRALEKIAQRYDALSQQ
jgi:hypothetical protein